MTTKIKIPKTLEEAGERLVTLDSISRATGWERAAIVYAFTRDGTGGATDENRSTSTTVPMTPRQFAKLGYAGLKSDTTVREYRKAWQWAIDNGMAVEVKPGDAITAPNHDWPPSPRQHRSTKEEVVEGFRKMVDEDPKAAVRELIQDSPETVSKLAKGVRTNPAVAGLAATPSLDEDEQGRTSIPREPHVTDYGKDLRSAVNSMQRVLVGIRDNKWSPDNMERTLIAFMVMALNEAMSGDSVASVIDEIENFLSQEAQR